MEIKIVPACCQPRKVKNEKTGEVVEIPPEVVGHLMVRVPAYYERTQIVNEVGYVDYLREVKELKALIPDDAERETPASILELKFVGRVSKRIQEYIVGVDLKTADGELEVTDVETFFCSPFADSILPELAMKFVMGDFMTKNSKRPSEPQPSQSTTGIKRSGTKRRQSSSSTTND